MIDTYKQQMLDKASTLPQKAGCYLMKNKRDEIIYVGKAKKLKERVKSYFNNSEKSAKTHVLVRHIRDFDFIVTQSDAESYVLENNLIKRHMPKYNIRLKDDKSYPYIVVDRNHDFPRLLFKRRPKRGKNIELFGPYPTGSNISRMLRLLTKSFSLRDCSDTEFSKRKTACILHQMHQCSAPCVDQISKNNYEKDLKSALNFFKGERLAKSSFDKLQQRMLKLAEQEKFEQAAMVRDHLSIIEEFMSQSFKQNVEFQHEKDIDIISYFVGKDQIDISLYLVRHGNLLGQRNFYFAASDLIDDIESEVAQYLIQYYAQNDEVLPEMVYITVADEITASFEEALNQVLATTRAIKVINRSDKYRPLGQMVKTHAQEAQRVRVENEQSVFVGLNKLKELLNLKSRPQVLECYDIAIWQGKSPTAAQIVFHDGVADKKKYRHYKLKELPEGNNDFAMMAEVFQRRLKHGDLPDVFIVDGGQGQVSTVKKVLEELGVDTPVIGIAKSKDLKIRSKTDITKSEERLIIPGRSNPYILKKNMSLFRIIVQMRDEAHRFSRRLHHKHEHKRALASWVDQVKGVPDSVRKTILTNQRSSFDELKLMSEQELSQELKVYEKRYLTSIFRYLKTFQN